MERIPFLPLGAGYRGNAPLAVAEESEDSGVQEWALGEVGSVAACGACRPGGGERKAERAERPRGGCAALPFKLWGVSVLASRRCDQSESPEGNKLCKSPSGDGSDDSDSLKNLPLRELAV